MFSATIISGSNDDKYLMCDKDGTILVKENPDDAVRDVEDSYNRNHGRGYEASMSACVHNIFFQPTIVQISEDLVEVATLLVDMSISHLGHISGHYHGRKLKKEAADELLKTSIKPRLISPA